MQFFYVSLLDTEGNGRGISSFKFKYQAIYQ